jgi:hypothetical protein
MTGVNLHTAYRESLVGLIELLRLVDEKRWRDVLERHLTEWDRSGDVRPQLAVYGGQGSFVDVLLTEANGHRVTRLQEGWVNECFEALSHACWTAAARIDRPDRVVEEGLPGEPLQGWVCRACGRRYVDPYRLQFAAARRWTRQAVPEAIATGRGAEVARRAYHFDEDPGCQAQLEELDAAMGALGHPAVPENFNYMDDPCPRCSRRHWAVFRWDVLEAPLRLQESPSNLPMRSEPPE